MLREKPQRMSHAGNSGMLMCKESLKERLNINCKERDYVCQQKEESNKRIGNIKINTKI